MGREKYINELSPRELKTTDYNKQLNYLNKCKHKSKFSQSDINRLSMCTQGLSTTFPEESRYIQRKIDGRSWTFDPANGLWYLKEIVAELYDLLKKALTLMNENLKRTEKTGKHDRIKNSTTHVTTNHTNDYSITKQKTKSSQEAEIQRKLDRYNRKVAQRASNARMSSAMEQSSSPKIMAK